MQPPYAARPFTPSDLTVPIRPLEARWLRQAIAEGRHPARRMAGLDHPTLRLRLDGTPNSKITVLRHWPSEGPSPCRTLPGCNRASINVARCESLHVALLDGRLLVAGTEAGAARHASARAWVFEVIYYSSRLRFAMFDHHPPTNTAVRIGTILGLLAIYGFILYFVLA